MSYSKETIMVFSPLDQTSRFFVNILGIDTIFKEVTY